jgi:hypothetical protein
MIRYLTTGQVARRLRVSVSTLKRWLVDPEVTIVERRNCNDTDIDTLRTHKLRLKRNGKRFNEATLIPIMTSTAGMLRIQKSL